MSKEKLPTMYTCIPVTCTVFVFFLLQLKLFKVGRVCSVCGTASGRLRDICHHGSILYVHQPCRDWSSVDKDDKKDYLEKSNPYRKLDSISQTQMWMSGSKRSRTGPGVCPGVCTLGAGHSAGRPLMGKTSDCGPNQDSCFLSSWQWTWNSKRSPFVYLFLEKSYLKRAHTPTHTFITESILCLNSFS